MLIKKRKIYFYAFLFVHEPCVYWIISPYFYQIIFLSNNVFEIVCFINYVAYHCLNKCNFVQLNFLSYFSSDLLSLFAL